MLKLITLSAIGLQSINWGGTFQTRVRSFGIRQSKNSRTVSSILEKFTHFTLKLSYSPDFPHWQVKSSGLRQSKKLKVADGLWLKGWKSKYYTVHLVFRAHDADEKAMSSGVTHLNGHKQPSLQTTAITSTQ